MLGLCSLMALACVACSHRHECGVQVPRKHGIFEPFNGDMADLLILDNHPLSEAQMTEVLSTARLILIQGGWEGGDDWVVIEPSGQMKLDYAYRGAMSPAPFRRVVAQVNPEGLAQIRKQFVARHFQDWPLESVATHVADGTQSWVIVDGEGFTKKSYWSNTCTQDMAGLFADVEKVIQDEMLTTVISTEDYNEPTSHRGLPDSFPREPAIMPSTQPSSDHK